MAFSIQFLGATRVVTGSCFLVEAGDTKFLVDCGMYQGPDVEARNFEDFDFNPEEIDFMLLTHAHLDHCGMVPKLYRHGFKGEIYATLHTVQLAEIIMRDSAKIQENNYTQGIPWKFSKRVEIAYDMKDADQAVQSCAIVNFDETFAPAADLKITPKVAGHVLGAASFEIEYEGKTVVFSGDIGRVNQDLIDGFDLDYKKEVDYVLMESLYGGETHPNRSESVNEMVNIIRDTIERGGSVYIPCFAVQRTQEIINDLKLAKQSGALPEDLPVWLDSPMAQKVTDIYSAALDHSEESNFNFPGMNFVKYHRQSQKISKRKGQVIIAGSGMAEGGRILSHLIGNAGNPKNSFIFVGFQAEKTIGRSIVEGSKKVTIDEKQVEIKADVHHLHGFSAHGDTNDYVHWLKRYNTPKLKKTFLIHAEMDRADRMKKELEDLKIDHPYIPDRREKFYFE